MSLQRVASAPTGAHNGRMADQPTPEQPPLRIQRPEPLGILPVNRYGCAWNGCAWPIAAFAILVVLYLPWYFTQRTPTGVHWGVSLFVDLFIVALAWGYRIQNLEEARKAQEAQAAEAAGADAQPPSEPPEAPAS